jgi:hypothetical protein
MGMSQLAIIVVAVIAIGIAWKVLKGVVKTVALIAILLIAFGVVYGGGF